MWWDYVIPDADAAGGGGDCDENGADDDTLRLNHYN